MYICALCVIHLLMQVIDSLVCHLYVCFDCTCLCVDLSILFADKVHH